MASEARFFETPAAFRAWLARNHGSARELHVGFWKVHTHARGRASMTWPQSVREALCFGWIDGVRRRLDAESYVIRFTPRRSRSRWSAVNIRLIKELEAAGLLTEVGRAVFEARPHKTGPEARGYSYERRDAILDPASVRRFKRDKGAWAYFEAQAPWYRRMVSWWVVSAKKEETRERRLAKLIEWSRKCKRL